jgi:hypothetical protein
VEKDAARRQAEDHDLGIRGNRSRRRRNPHNAVHIEDRIAPDERGMIGAETEAGRRAEVDLCENIEAASIRIDL